MQAQAKKQPFRHQETWGGMDGPINQATTTNGSSFRSQKSCTFCWWLFTAIVLGFITICQGPFGLRVESFGDNLLPSDKSQKIVVSSWPMEQRVVDTVPEKKDAFLSGLEFKGEVATSVRYFNSTHLWQAYLGRRDCHKWEYSSHLQLIDYLQIWPVPKETKHPITFKGFPRN